MITNNHISFIYGVLTNFVDDMNDYNTISKVKIGLESILAILTIYILYFTKKLGFVTSVLFSFGSMIYIFFAPDVLSSNIFRLLAALSFPPMFYHLYENLHLIKNNQYFLRILTYSFVVGGIFIIIEDKMVPEEFSYRKLFERIFQLLLMILILMYINKLELTPDQTDAISWIAYGWSGYMVSNIATMLYLMFWLGLSPPINV